MNKQELIESITYLPSDCSGLRPMIDKLTTLELIKLLDEPEKVKIPEFVANIIEEYKERNAPIIDIFTEKKYNKKYNWWLATSLNAYDRAARAWLDGYEVEKEAKYTVKAKGVANSTKNLAFGKISGEWFFASSRLSNVITKHTRKELEEAGFGWVFDCEGIEVEEAE